MALDKTIFKGKTLSDIFAEIHDNSSTTRNQVSGLIAELKPLIENVGDATLIVPMIKEYMEIGVKNDEHLIKMAAIIQRLESSASKGGSEDFFDPSELADLLEEMEENNDNLAEKSQDKDTEDE